MPNILPQDQATSPQAPSAEPPVMGGNTFSIEDYDFAFKNEDGHEPEHMNFMREELKSHKFSVNDLKYAKDFMDLDPSFMVQKQSEMTRSEDDDILIEVTEDPSKIVNYMSPLAKDNYIKNSAITGDDSLAYRHINALHYSKVYGKSVDEIMANYDNYKNEYHATDLDDEEAMQQIKGIWNPSTAEGGIGAEFDKFKGNWNIASERENFMEDLYTKILAGDDISEDLTSYKAMLAKPRSKMTSDNPVYQSLQEVATMGSGIVGSWVEGLKGSAIGGAGGFMIGGVPTAIAGASKGFSAANFKFWASQGTSQMMLDMVDSGIPQDLARKIAIPMGLVYAGIEKIGTLDRVPMLRGKSKSASATGVTSYLKIKLMNYVVAVIKEASEEGLQEGVEQFAQRIGYELSPEDLKANIKDIPTFESASKDMVKTTVDSIPAIMWLGGGQAMFEKVDIAPETQAEKDARNAKHKKDVEDELTKLEQSMVNDINVTEEDGSPAKDDTLEIKTMMHAWMNKHKDEDQAEFLTNLELLTQKSGLKEVGDMSRRELLDELGLDKAPITVRGTLENMVSDNRRKLIIPKENMARFKKSLALELDPADMVTKDVAVDALEENIKIIEEKIDRDEELTKAESHLLEIQREEQTPDGKYFDTIVNRVVDWSRENVIDEMAETEEKAAEMKEQVKGDSLLRKFTDYMADSTGRSIVSTGQNLVMADRVRDKIHTVEEAVELVKQSGIDMDQFALDTDEQILEKIIIKGYNDGTTSYIMKTGDITTPIEEVSEEFYKESASDSDNGKVFANMIQNNRRAYEKATGEVTEQSDVEWFSDRVVDYAIKDTPFWEGADGQIKGIMAMLKQLSSMIVDRAATTMNMIKEGTLSKSFEKSLQESYAPFVGAKKKLSEKEAYAKKMSEVVEVPKEEIKVVENIFKVIQVEVDELTQQANKLKNKISKLDKKFKAATTKVKRRNARVERRGAEKELSALENDIRELQSVKKDEVALIKWDRARKQIQKQLSIEEEVSKAKQLADNKQISEGKKKTLSKYEFSLNKILERAQSVADEISELKGQLEILANMQNKNSDKYIESMERIESKLLEKELELEKIENAAETELANVEQLFSQDTHRRGKKRRAKMRKKQEKLDVTTYQLSVLNEENSTETEKILISKMEKPKKGQRYTSKENAIARQKLKRVNNLAQALIKHKDDVQAKAKELRKFVVDNLPPAERERILTKNLMKLIDGKLHAQTKDVQSIFDTAVAEVKKAVDDVAVKELKQMFKKELDKIPAMKGKIPKGTRVDSDSKQLLDDIKRIAEMTAEQLEKAVEVAQTMSDYDPKGNVDREVAEAKADKNLALYGAFGSYKNMDSAALNVAIHDLKTLFAKGEELYLVAKTKKDQKRAALKEEFLNEITGGKGVLEQSEMTKYIAGNAERKKQMANKTLLGLQNIATISDIMSNDRTQNMMEGAISKYLNTKMQKMDDTYHKNLAGEYAKIQKIYKKWFGDDQDTLNQMEEVRENSGVFVKKKNGEMEELLISYADAITFTILEMNNKGTQAQENAGFTPATYRQLREFMATGEQYLPSKQSMVKFGEELLDYYNNYYDRVNEVYKKVYGINLPKEEFYSPLRIFKVSDVEETKLLNEGGARASLVTSALKTRTNHKNEMKTSDVSAFKILIHHVTGMENFIAKAESMQEIRSVLQSEEIKQAITQEVGNEVNLALRDAFNRYEVGALNSLHKIDTLDKVLSNYTRAKIALKVGSTSKQLSSNLAYAINMPIKDFVKGMANFMANPQLWADRAGELMESEFMKERYAKGIDPVMRSALEGQTSSEQEALLKPDFNKKLANMLMFFTKAGDAMAIISGGWALYDYKKKEYRASGMSEADAKAEAMLDFENATALMQQSGKSKDVGSFQESGNSMLRLFTMFQNSQFAYWRMVQSGYRNLRKGRGSKAQALKALAIAGVILPASFATMSLANKASWAVLTGNLDDPDEEEAMRRAMLAIATSPFSSNPLPIIGDAGEAIANSLFGNHVPWIGQLPVFGEMYRFGKIGSAVYDAEFLDAFKQIKSIAGSLMGMPFDQMWDTIDDLLKASDVIDKD